MIVSLPRELIVAIGSELTLPSLISISLSCRYLYKIMSTIVQQRLSNLPWQISVDYQWDPTQRQPDIVSSSVTIGWSTATLPEGSERSRRDKEIQTTVWSGVGGEILDRIINSDYPIPIRFQTVSLMVERLLFPVEIGQFAIGYQFDEADLTIGSLEPCPPTSPRVQGQRIKRYPVADGLSSYMTYSNRRTDDLV